MSSSLLEKLESMVLIVEFAQKLPSDFLLKDWLLVSLYWL